MKLLTTVNIQIETPERKFTPDVRREVTQAVCDALESKTLISRFNRGNGARQMTSYMKIMHSKGLCGFDGGSTKEIMLSGFRCECWDYAEALVSALRSGRKHGKKA